MYNVYERVLNQKKMKTNNSFSQILKARESVHCFSGEKIDDELSAKVNSIIKQIDSLPSLFENVVTRLHLADKSLRSRQFSGEIGWVIGSMFVPKEKEKIPLYQVDLGYKMFRLSLEFEKIGISSCITAHALDPEKVIQDTKKYHTMEFDAPLALCFGIKSNRGSIFARIQQWLGHDSYRLPIDQIIVNYKSTNKISAEKEELISLSSRAPSIGNTQTWRIYLETGMFHFYAVSALNERFFNLGCFLGAFEPLSKQLKFKGEWTITEHPNIEGEYCISYILK